MLVCGNCCGSLGLLASIESQLVTTRQWLIVIIIHCSYFTPEMNTHIAYIKKKPGRFIRAFILVAVSHERKRVTDTACASSAADTVHVVLIALRS